MTEGRGRARLVVADDGHSEIASIVSLLSSESYSAPRCRLDETLLATVAERRPELVIIGWSHGHSRTMWLFRALRRRTDVPILVLAEGAADVDVDAAFEAGIDGIITGRVRPDELLARIRALLRRARRRRPSAEPTSTGFVLDVRARSLTAASGVHALSEHACLLLTMLIGGEGRVVTRTALARALWNKPPESCRKALDAHVGRLREKIELDPGQPVVLQTVRALGFLLERGAGAMVERADDVHVDLTRVAPAVVDLTRPTSQDLDPVHAPFVVPRTRVPTVLA